MNRKSDPQQFTSMQVYPDTLVWLRELLPQFRNDAERFQQLRAAFELMRSEARAQPVWVPTLRKEEQP